MTAPALPGWKRSIDIAFSLAALPVLALAALFIATVMALAAPGPVLYRQERVGYRGRRILCYRFRTMRVAGDRRGDDSADAETDARTGARLIPGGWLMRALHLDHLPQILNVLEGDMSAVGPRPCLPRGFTRLFPWQRARCNAMPGLTGLWQVSGRTSGNVDEMIRLDLQYIEKQSIGMDLKIIARTGPAVFRRLREADDNRRALQKSADSAQA